MSGQRDGAGPGDPEPAEPEPIGSVAEEAAKLLGAFSTWAKEQGEGMSSFTEGMHEHVEAGRPPGAPAAECQWCPLCRTVAAVRQTSPEVVGHLSSAAASFMLALSGLMTPPPAADGGADDERARRDDHGDDPDERRADDRVQRIPLDDDWLEDDE